MPRLRFFAQCAAGLMAGALVQSALTAAAMAEVVELPFQHGGFQADEMHVLVLVSAGGFDFLSDDGELAFDASRLAPMVSWGTSPEDCAPVDGVQ